MIVHVEVFLAKATIISGRLIQVPIYLPHSSLPTVNHSSRNESLSTAGEEPASRQTLPFIWYRLRLLITKNMDNTF